MNEAGRHANVHSLPGRLPERSQISIAYWVNNGKYHGGKSAPEIVRVELFAEQPEEPWHRSLKCSDIYRAGQTYASHEAMHSMLSKTLCHLSWRVSEGPTAPGTKDEVGLCGLQTQSEEAYCLLRLPYDKVLHMNGTNDQAACKLRGLR